MWASLTLKNYPNVYIFCLNPRNGKEASIQVKTIRKGRNYFVPRNADRLEQPFVFVRIKADESVQFFIVPSKDVEQLSKAGEEKYIRDHPNVSKKQPRMLSVKDLKPYKDSWERLGLH